MFRVPLCQSLPCRTACILVHSTIVPQLCFCTEFKESLALCEFVILQSLHHDDPLRVFFNGLFVNARDVHDESTGFVALPAS